MKAILVLDKMPDCCGECEFCYPAIMNEHEEIFRCFLTGLDAPTTILDDCPLRPMPECVDQEPKGNYDGMVYVTDHTKEHKRGFTDGWNACLDAITGGEK